MNVHRMILSSILLFGSAHMQSAGEDKTAYQSCVESWARVRRCAQVNTIQCGTVLKNKSNYKLSCDVNMPSVVAGVTAGTLCWGVNRITLPRRATSCMFHQIRANRGVRILSCLLPAMYVYQSVAQNPQMQDSVCSVVSTVEDTIVGLLS